MSLRSIRETIDDLRTILHRFEHLPGADFDEYALAELKRIILDRIAEIEAQQALSENLAPAVVAQASDSVPSLSGSNIVAELQSLAEASEHVPPNKLD